MVPSIIVGDKEGIFTSVPGVEPPDGKLASATSGCPADSKINDNDYGMFFSVKN